MVTVVQIDSSFVYYLSILMIETEFIVLALKKRAYLLVIGDWTFQPPTIQPPTCKYTPYKIYRYIHDHHLMSLSQDTACIRSPALVFWR